MKYRQYLNSSGQGLVEYAIILVVVALVIASLLAVYGDEVVDLYQSVIDMW